VPTIRANGVDLCYEAHGDEADPALLLIHGHGAQLIAWHDDLVDALVGLGHYVVRFDNRDAGLSTHLDELALPDVFAIVDGDRSTVPYTIEDLADDAAMLARSLGLDGAHVFGVSMGGMVAQSVAIRHPGLVRSLTSVMSSPDPLRVGTPSPEVTATYLDAPPTSRDEVIERTLDSWRLTGSPALGIDEEWVRASTGRQFDRAYYPDGVTRQLGAIVGSDDRRPGLAGVTVPTLVVHGAIDPLITVEGGVATAKAVPGAELLVIDDMGHDLPRVVWPQVLDAVGTLTARA
jgi:pimeloyl-ACP methyl ester carboxylesterase